MDFKKLFEKEEENKVQQNSSCLFISWAFHLILLWMTKSLNSFAS